MKKKLILLFFLLGISSFSYEDFSYEEPVIRTGVKQATRNINTSFVYRQNDMYRVYCRAGFLTQIQLNPDETVVYLAGGDTARWAIDEGVTGSMEGARKVIMIKPFYPDIKTNLVINTDKRSYNIFLISDKNVFNPLINFIYPQKKVKKPTYITKTVRKSIMELRINNRYKWNTKSKFAPVQVFDDGQKTYICMKNSISTGEAPVFYIKDSQTKEDVLARYRVTTENPIFYRKNEQGQMVKYQIKTNKKNTYYIVDQLFDIGTLKLGKEKVQIQKYGELVEKNKTGNYPIR